jgi:hypothetical protein
VTRPSSLSKAIGELGPAQSSTFWPVSAVGVLALVFCRISSRRIGITSMIEKSSAEVIGVDQLAAVCPSLPIKQNLESVARNAVFLMKGTFCDLADQGQIAF